MYTNNKLAKSVRLALVAGGASIAFGSTTAMAQDSSEVAEAQERIQVTGSRIKRTDLESASPITVFDAEDLAESGHVTIEKFVHSIPSMNGGYNGANTNNGSGGFASASLRGLGSSRTLILINGRRFASGDLNSIPMSFIERVEVLRDGASTIYGSDAIAGVINFITKRDFEGAEFSAQYDLTGEGDGETTKVSGTIGHSTGRGNVVLGLEYTNRNTIGQGDRDFSRIPYGESDDGRLVPAGSTANSFGTWTSLLEGSQYGPNNGLNVVDPETGEIRAFNSETDAYNFAPASYLVTPQEVFSINAAATYDLTPNITAFLEGGFTNRQSDQLMAADGTFWGATMAAEHPDNPIGEDLAVSRRLEETGGRNFTQDFADFRMVTGLEGYLDNGWSWDVSYNYARYVNNILDIGRANPEAFNAMLDPALCDADDACPGLWNPLEANSLTQEQLDYGTIPNSPVERGTTKQLMANLTGDTGSFGFDAGTIGWAIGVEKRWEEYSYVPDGGATVGAIYSVTPAPSEGAYDLNEAYAEVNVPVLAGMPWAESLNLSGAVRYSDYSFLDSETVTKFGVEWQPVDGLMIRATQADGFRAPSISNLFDPQAETNTAYDDPCINWGTADIDATTRANCEAEGVPANFNPPNNQSASIAGGNPDLGPEKSDSFTAGFVYTPTGMPNFSLAVDYYDIEITNGLGAASATALVQDCYASEDFSSPSCDLILGPSAPIINRPGFPGSDFRANDGIVAGILTTTANIATFETSGIDFDATYLVEDFFGGDLNFRLDGTYLDKYSYQSQEGAAVLELAGKFAADPNFGGRVAAFSQIRSNLSVGYSLDQFDVTWIARYQDATEDLNASTDNLSNKAGSVVYHDLQANYYMANDVTLTFGARNLFDKQPPYVTNNNDMNTLNSSYDTAGQYWYARVGVRF